MFGHIPIRRIFYAGSAASILAIEAIALYWPPIRWAYVPVLPLVALGVRDTLQTRHAILRNFPILGHGRYLLEAIRPEINQYFVESDIDGRPFNRQERSNVYQRAKRDLNKTPFGTQLNVYEEGYEWINHSIGALPPLDEEPRVRIGGPDCSQPYSASLLNISAMSYGSLSTNAILALNKGAKLGNFYHNTGEGGISPYHLEPGGDLVWQVGTGYFGCRTSEGKFCPVRFSERASLPTVKMIEIKLSQGAKPGHGGILPKAKITPEIAEIRGVSMDEDVLSPPCHTAFETPLEMMAFIAELREFSGGKPVGFKLCLGNPHEFMALCKAMIETGIAPDFITVDGGEGGTGAAPIEFSDRMGTPLIEGLVFVNNALVGAGLRDRIRIIAAGKITTGFQLAKKIAMGADFCNSARGMMFSLGCIQALQCHANTCPTGVATQDKELVKGLVVEHKYKRVANYQKATVHNFLEILGAAGLTYPSELKPWHIYRRISPTEVRHLGEIYPALKQGVLVASDDMPENYRTAWKTANTHTFLPMVPDYNAPPF